MKSLKDNEEFVKSLKSKGKLFLSEAAAKWKSMNE